MVHLYGSLLAALKALRVNIMRSVLTTLGIIIGVAAVIIMVSVGSGAEARVDKLIQSIGSNLIIVLNGATTSSGARMGSGTQPSLTEEDAAAIARELPDVQVAAPQVRGSGQIIYGNSNWYTVIRGITGDYLTATDWSVGQGRLFTPEEIRGAAKVALIGQTVAENLFGGLDPIGQLIRINRVPFRIIGLLAEKGQTGMGHDQDDIVVIPISTAKKRVLGGRRLTGDLVGAIFVKAWEKDLVGQVEEQVKELLRQRHRIRSGQPDDFSVRNLSQMLDTAAESSRTLSLLLAAVASVSLLVGGIGIMNIMLVSVTERTKEIGLRMAVGAKGRDIMAQFLIESVTLSLIGGLIGITIGLAGSTAIARLGQWPAIIEPQAMALAFGFSGAVGVFFGFYPARKAAKLNPIDALHRE